MNTTAHGNHSQRMDGQILHNYPTGGFNAEGIEELRKVILNLIPQDRPWVLFEHPKTEAGLTPDGVDALRQLYKDLSHHGCIAIGIEIGFTFGGVIQHEILRHLSLPTKVAQNEQEITAFLEEALKNVSSGS